MTTHADEGAMAAFIEINACARRIVRHYRQQHLLDEAERHACIVRIAELNVAIHEAADREEPKRWTAEDWLRWESLRDQHMALLSEWRELRESAEAGA